MAEPKTELPKVIVIGRPTVFQFYDEQLSQKFRILKPWESSLPLEQFICTNAQSVQAMICSPNRIGSQLSSSLFRLLPSLRLIVTTSTGLDHIDLVECRRRGISVASAAAIFSEDVADFAVGLLIDVVRKISAADRFVKNGVWPLQGHFPLGSKHMKYTVIISIDCILELSPGQSLNLRIRGIHAIEPQSSITFIKTFSSKGHSHTLVADIRMC